jgi:3-oxoacyl-[acyl-carrier protein] reductase
LTFIITGSSRGLGFELCKYISQRGDNVIGISRSKCNYQHPKFHHYQLDICDEKAVVDFFKEVRSSHKIKCLVNNAGISLSSLALFTGHESFSKTLNVNLTGAFLASREALKQMKANQFGRIINISSVNVKLSSAGGIAYNASKAGLESMAKTFTAETSSKENITINNIGISLVEKFGMIQALSEKSIDEKSRLLKRPDLLNIKEILFTIDFFVSPLSSNISGQTIYFGGIW